MDRQIEAERWEVEKQAEVERRDMEWKYEGHGMEI